MQSQPSITDKLICPWCEYIDYEGYDYFDDLDTEEEITCINCNMTFYASIETIYHIRRNK